MTYTYEAQLENQPGNSCTKPMQIQLEASRRLFAYQSSLT